jgi:glutaredoxin 3
MTEPALELYELRGCPYCAKVRRALADLDLSYESHYVPQRKSQRTAVQAVSDQSQVPVLVDTTNGVEGMPESDDIVEYVYETYGDGQEPPPSGVRGRIYSLLF